MGREDHHLVLERMTALCPLSLGRVEADEDVT